jgi:uncharacterized BrkB/YihY/UPF0761 family membrane protein
MSSTRKVPETRLMAEVELSPDHAWRALCRYGGWRLLRDAFARFRYGDGFSHARAVAFQLCLAAVPLLIASQGLATKLGLQGGRVVAETVLELTPGSSQSLVTQLLADDERIQDIGEVALTLGLIAAILALTSSVGQIERGANRIYGIQRDRPFAHKYLRALVLAVAAGIPALTSFLMLVAGGAIGESMGRSYHWSGNATAIWNVLRWPASLLLAGYVGASGSFGDIYGPLTAVMTLLLWAMLTAIALLLGIAFTAQLEARRVGVPEPVVRDRWEPAGHANGQAEQPDATQHRSDTSRKGAGAGQGRGEKAGAR